MSDTIARGGSPPMAERRLPTVCPECNRIISEGPFPVSRHSDYCTVELRAEIANLKSKNAALREEHEKLRAKEVKFRELAFADAHQTIQALEAENKNLREENQRLKQALLDQEEWRDDGIPL